MTKKDYILIANAIKDVDKKTSEGTSAKEYRAALLMVFVLYFKVDNVRFDASRFMDYINNPDKRYKDITDK